MREKKKGERWGEGKKQKMHSYAYTINLSRTVMTVDEFARTFIEARGYTVLTRDELLVSVLYDRKKTGKLKSNSDMKETISRVLASGLEHSLTEDEKEIKQLIRKKIAGGRILPGEELDQVVKIMDYGGLEYSTIFVDEFECASVSFVKFLSKLANSSTCVILFGDDDQAIRKNPLASFKELLNHFPDISGFELNENHRYKNKLYGGFRLISCLMGKDRLEPRGICKYIVEPKNNSKASRKDEEEMPIDIVEHDKLLHHVKSVTVKHQRVGVIFPSNEEARDFFVKLKENGQSPVLLDPDLTPDLASLCSMRGHAPNHLIQKLLEVTSMEGGSENMEKLNTLVGARGNQKFFSLLHNLLSSEVFSCCFVCK